MFLLVIWRWGQNPKICRNFTALFGSIKFLKIEYDMFGAQKLAMYGVLNDEGTRLYIKGKIQVLNFESKF